MKKNNNINDVCVCVETSQEDFHHLAFSDEKKKWTENRFFFFIDLIETGQQTNDDDYNQMFAEIIVKIANKQMNE